MFKSLCATKLMCCATMVGLIVSCTNDYGTTGINLGKQALCRHATTFQASGITWAPNAIDARYIEEAKARGYSLHTCKATYPSTGLTPTNLYEGYLYEMSSFSICNLAINKSEGRYDWAYRPDALRYVNEAKRRNMTILACIFKTSLPPTPKDKADQRSRFDSKDEKYVCSVAVTLENGHPEWDNLAPRRHINTAKGWGLTLEECASIVDWQ